MRKIPLTEIILFALEKSVETGEAIFGSAIELKEWIYSVYGNYPKEINKNSLSQAIKRLRKRNLIEKEEERTGKIVLRLTQSGKDLALLKKGESDINWDGRWRIVVFDIPENKRVVRDLLRSRLKSWGFVGWQKSVWASKRNVTYQLRSFLRELGISDWVLVIESDNVGT